MADTFANALTKFRSEAPKPDPFEQAMRDMSERAEYEAWAETTDMTEAERAEFAREYAEAECASARFDERFPDLVA